MNEITYRMELTMGTEDLIAQLGSKEFLNKLYGFSYERCNSSHEADDLCSEIILSILKSIRKGTVIHNFYAFAWAVAYRTYADFCEKRKTYNNRTVSTTFSDDILGIQADPFDEYLDQQADATHLTKIKRDIAFLSKSYRDVMVMYYLDDMKIVDIAICLNISETAVKQRLFSARNTIKKEVEKVDSNHITLQPIKMHFLGTGNPVGNDPRIKATRTLSQNIVYLCKNTARSAKEISELLHIPMLYVEEELEIQVKGENGHYGLLRKLDNNKYISNFILLDLEEFEKSSSVFKQQAELLTARINIYLEKNKDLILNFPFLNHQKDMQNDIHFITWSLISRMIWSYEHEVLQIVKDKYLPDIQLLKRDFSTIGIAYPNNQNMKIGFFGCDGIMSYDICGYPKVSCCNIYGDRITKHFGCGHNISNDPALLMTVNSINGIAIDTLSEDDKEIAAKAMENNYLIKNNGMLYPKILVLDSKNENDFYNLSYEFSEETNDLAETAANQIVELIKKLIPKHLMNEYDQLILQSTCGLLNDVIEQCIHNGILHVPDRTPCAEGTWMIVEK